MTTTKANAATPALPPSILELEGAIWSAPGAGAAALVIVDAQNEYLSGPLALDGVEAAAEEIRRLRAFADARGWPVVHVRHKGAPGSLFDLDAPRGAFMAGLQPKGDEAVVTKVHADSFAETDLGAVLARLGVKSLIVAGFMTHNCVSSTVRRAVVEGFEVAIVTTSTATRALPLLGRAMSAREVQEGTLTALADTHAFLFVDTAALGVALR